MTLQFSRFGTSRCMQPIGMLVESYVLGSIGPPDASSSWVLDPSFQRGAVWTQQQKQAWIESILMDVGLPAIVVNRFPGRHPIYGYNEIVIDGQQRLRATAEFMRSEFPVRGDYWKDQSAVFRREFTMSSGLTPVIYCSYRTERECAELYLKLLAAGTEHTADEIQQAVEVARTLTT